MGAAIVMFGLLAVGTCHQRAEPVYAPSDHGDVCLSLLQVRDALLRERPPPPFATSEQALAAAEINAVLAYIRGRLFELDGIRQLRCQEG